MNNNKKYMVKEGENIINKYAENNNISEGNHIVQFDHNAFPIELLEILCPYSKVPIVLKKELSQKLKDISSAIPELLSSTISYYFKNNLKDIAEFFFEGNLNKAKLLVNTPYINSLHNSRADLYFNGNDFKILEFNSGSMVAGWEPSLCIELSGIEIETVEGYNQIKTYYIYLEFIVSNTLKYWNGKIENNELNIGIIIHDYFQIDYTFMEELINNNFSNINVNFMAMSEENLEKKNGNIFFENKKIHSLFNMADIEVSDYFYDIQEDCFFYTPDTIWNEVIGNKSLLNILKELSNNNIFNEKETKIINEAILWSVDLANKNIIFDNNNINLIDLLLSKKDLFVVKPNTGEKGRDLIVGKFLTNKEFEHKIKLALSSKETFIVQEYVESLPINFIGKEDVTHHHVVWGAIQFGDSYGGTYARVKEEDNSYNGVINVDKGALEVIVFEYTK
jgi:hypothetical protein